MRVYVCVYVCWPDERIGEKLTVTKLRWFYVLT